MCDSLQGKLCRFCAARPKITLLWANALTLKVLPALGTSPCSVMMPAMRCAGVTSKDGFQVCNTMHSHTSQAV